MPLQRNIMHIVILRRRWIALIEMICQPLSCMSVPVWCVNCTMCCELLRMQESSIDRCRSAGDWNRRWRHWSRWRKEWGCLCFVLVWTPGENIKSFEKLSFWEQHALTSSSNKSKYVNPRKPKLWAIKPLLWSQSSLKRVQRDLHDRSFSLHFHNAFEFHGCQACM